MCHYTQVGYSCGHCRYTVREWCESYETTHRRCPLHVVAIEKRYALSIPPSLHPPFPSISMLIRTRTREICSSCTPAQEPSWMKDFIRLAEQYPRKNEECRRNRVVCARMPRQTLASTVGMQCYRPEAVQQRSSSGDSWGCVRI